MVVFETNENEDRDSSYVTFHNFCYSNGISNVFPGISLEISLKNISLFFFLSFHFPFIRHRIQCGFNKKPG